MTDRQMRQWVAHAKIGGNIIEVIVWDINRALAVDQAHRKLGLTGPTDPKLEGPFRIEELELKTNDVVPEIPPRDKSKDKRYRASVYVSPLSRDMKVLNLRTSSAQQALWSVMGMFKVRAEMDLGPYLVEEERPEGWVTILYKNLHSFANHGPIEGKVEEVPSTGMAIVPYDPPPRQTPASSGYNEQVIDTDALEQEWSDAWAQHLGQSRAAQQAEKRETFITKVKSIFDGEKTVRKPNVKIVKR